MLDPIFNSSLMENLLTLPWFQLIFTIIIAALASTKATFQSFVCKRHIRNSQDSILYNTMFFVFVAIFLSMTLNTMIPNTEIIIWALLMSIGSVLFQILYSIALSAGPVSITILIINFAVVVPTFASAVIFKEEVFVSQLLGIVCLLISFPLSIKEGGSGQQKANKKWLIFTILTLIFDCLAMTMQKMFCVTESYKVHGAIASNTFLVFIYVFGAVLAFGIYWCIRMFGKKDYGANKHTFKFGLSILMFALAMGLDLAVYQKFYMTANLKIDGSFFFPTFSGLQSVCMTTIGILVFGDRLNKRQLLGVVFGIAAVILLNVQFGAAFTIA